DARLRPLSVRGRYRPRDPQGIRPPRGDRDGELRSNGRRKAVSSRDGEVAMESRIIGKLDFDAGRLTRELARVSEWQLSDAYEEYTVGYWRSLVLSNGTGEQWDGTIRGYPTERRLTPAGRSFAYIEELVRSHFDYARLKWSRLFVV